MRHITVSMSQKHGAESLGVAGARIRCFSYGWDAASHNATPAWSAAKPPHDKACHGYLFCADTQTLWRLDLMDLVSVRLRSDAHLGPSMGRALENY